MSALTGRQLLADLADDLGVSKLWLKPYETLAHIEYAPREYAVRVHINTSRVTEGARQTRLDRPGTRVVTYAHLNADLAPYEDWWVLESDRTYRDVQDVPTSTVIKHRELAGV